MSTELNQENFRRIYRLNWILCGPLLLLFGWALLFACGSRRPEWKLVWREGFFIFAYLHADDLTWSHCP